MNIKGENVNKNMQNLDNSGRTTCSDSALDKSELMKKIQALSFAKTETELYLDGHPEAVNALSYYKELLGRLDMLIEEYQAKYGPLYAGGVSGDSWTWVNTPWPWQYNKEEDA